MRSCRLALRSRRRTALGLLLALPLAARAGVQAGDNTRAAPGGPSGQPATRPDPSTVDGQLQLGRAALDQDKPAEAAEHYREALRQAPRNLEAMEGLAVAYQRQGNTADAVRYLTQAVVTAAEAGDTARAQTILTAAAKLDPTAPALLYARAKLLVGNARNAAAREAFQEYLRTDPGKRDYRAYHELGKLYLQDRLYRQALRHLEDAVRYGGTSDAEVLAAMADAYRAVRDFRKAEDQINQAINLRRTELAYYLIKAQILNDQGDYARAEESLRDGLRAAEDVRPASFAEEYRLLSHRQELESRLLEVLASRSALDPSDVRLLLQQATELQKLAALRHRMELYRAAEILARADRLQPGDLAILRELASVQERIGRTADALEAYREILQLKPDDAAAREALARLGGTQTRPAAK